ncbi:hypothetical protein HAQ03_05190 [Acidithiobacillus caldus]|uniref:toprim domain-containing protein n=1 Tax=Acidithiobacillus caldus TaxID=33059 RepID=UPI001C073677|nr:toprim domain-containing protein [Acidithiobacillus caldus]MBU2762821.1 hypothetical protein [Acidithiobacillus caldus]
MKRFPKKTYEINRLLVALQAAGIPCRRQGKEIEADFNGTGHHSFKLSPALGVYLDTATGSGGTIAALLRRKRLDAAVIAATATASTANPTPRPAAGGQQKDTQALARRVWSASWTCTHEADMPAGWDQGLAVVAKGNRRRSLEGERDAAIAYLRSRLGATHLLHWLRQARVGRTLDGQPMLVLPMQQVGTLSGIQRVILDGSGQKIERRMLGRHGCMPLPAPVGVQPAQLVPDVSCVIVVGEGFETDASVVQAVGHPGIAAMDAGGLRRWADEQAAAAAQASPERLARAPAVIVLADRDVSGTGQKAAAYAVRTLRAAGLRAYYAEPLPPEDGGPKGGNKGSDWNDYIREGLDGAMVAHLQLAVARGDELMPEPEPGETASADAAPVFDFSGVRPAETPAPVAPTAEISEVESAMQGELAAVVKSYVEWVQTPPEDRTPFQPHLFRVTTGVGKSQFVKDLAKSQTIRVAGGRLVVSAPDHEQLMDYEAAGMLHNWGRQPDESRAPQALCPNHKEMSEAQEKGHISQAEFCRRCSNGLAWSIKAATQELASGACTDKRVFILESRIEQHTQELKRRGLDPQAVDPCRWQDHLRDVIDSPAVCMTHDSYSHAVVGDALYFVDETFEIAKNVTITLADIHHWAAKNASILERLQQDQFADPELIDKHTKAAEVFRVLAQRIAVWAGEGKDGEVRADPELAESIGALLDLTQENVRLASWETLDFNKSGHLEDAPLRAAYALAESIKHIGGGHVNKGHLVVSALNPIIERIKIGLPTVFLDATPPPELIEIIEANGGKVHNYIVDQNIRLVRHVSRFMGLTELDPKRTDANRVQRALKFRQRLFDAFPDACTLDHKKATDQLPERDGLGHWGKHHRAHNAWSGRDLNIIGSFFPPEPTWRTLYQNSRLAALSAGCNPEQWPEWPGNAANVEGAWICEGTHEVQSRLPLPADPRIRRWLLAHITAETVQAIGRARGARSDRRITVRIFGGVPLHGLGQYGLQVDEYAADPIELGQTREAMNKERHEAAMERMDAAAARLVAKGEVITTETMAAEMRATGTYGPAAPENRFYGHGKKSNTKPVETFSASTYQQWLERIKVAAPALYAHMATTGRGAAVVRSMREAAERYGKAALKAAVEIAESLVTQGDSALWDTLDALDALDADAPTGTHGSLRAILASVLGDEAPPPPPPPPIH